MDQEIHFCTTSDDVTIAYATLGSGPPLLYVCGWPGHLAAEWERSFSREFLEDLGDGFTLVRYDMRGSGLSDRKAGDLSLESFVRDLEAVVDHLNLDTFALLSLGFLAGPVAMTYATANPDRVTGLVLSAAYLRGRDLTTPERQQALLQYISQFGVPLSLEEVDQADFEKWQDVARIQKMSASREVQAAVARIILAVDMSETVGRLSMPVLILHGQDDDMVPFACGRELATRIPHAKFVPFEGSTSAPWTRLNVLTPEMRRFLGPGTAEEGGSHTHDDLPLTILFTDLESSTALTQRLGDARAQGVLRVHNDIVREALAAHAGSEIKHTGDGIMASFHSASRALQCAIAIQQAVAAHVEEHPDTPLGVHIGLNAGEPVAEDDDLFGTAVQLARRACDRAEGGEILASNVVRELSAGKGFMFSDRGDVELRGFEDPVRLYEVRWRESAAGG